MKHCQTCACFQVETAERPPPDGYSSWYDAAVAERVRRVAAERRLRELGAVETPAVQCIWRSGCRNHRICDEMGHCQQLGAEKATCQCDPSGHGALPCPAHDQKTSQPQCKGECYEAYTDKACPVHGAQKASEPSFDLAQEIRKRLEPEKTSEEPDPEIVGTLNWRCVKCSQINPPQIDRCRGCHELQ